MDKALPVQQALNKKISNCFTNFKSKGRDSMTQGEAQARMECLNTWYGQFQKNHEIIVEYEDYARDHLYVTSNLHDLTEEAYYSNLGKFKDHLLSFGVQATSASNQPAAPNPQQFQFNTIHQSLPKVDIPVFSGEYSEWSNFKDIFTALVHDRQDLASSVKFYYLKSKLSGDALAKIQSVQVSNESYAETWESLINYYDNERRSVTLLVSKILAAKAMKGETSSEMKRLQKEIFGPLESLKALKREVDKWGDMIVGITVQRFDPNTLRDWEKYLGESFDAPTVDKLKKFFQSQTHTLESIENSSKGTANKSNSSQSKTPNVSKDSSNSKPLYVHQTNNSQNPQKALKCACCEQAHYVASCPKFKSLDYVGRKDLATREHLCYNCLGAHSIKKCSSQKRCFTCKGKHHTLLHNPSYPPKDSTNNGNLSCTESRQQHLGNNNGTVSNVTNSPNNSQINSMATSFVKSATSRTKYVLLSTARVFVVAPNGQKLLVRALIDQCSQCSVISTSLCQRLRLKQHRLNIPITGIGEEPAVFSKGITEFSIKPRFTSDFSYHLKAFVIPKVSSYRPPPVHYVSQLEHVKDLELADPNFADLDQIELLLGADVHSLIMKEELRRGNPQQPLATSTTLGWLLSGPANSSENSTLNSLASHHCAEQNAIDLDVLLREFWRLEEPPKPVNNYTAAEQECEDHFASTHNRNESGRYVVKLPFLKRQELPQYNLDSSFKPAHAMMKRMESKFQVEPKLHAAYKEFMHEYQDLGHMIPVPEEKIGPEIQRFYLPHHDVQKESSTTTKLRVVFNGSIRYDSGPALNKLLHVGPNLLPNLFDLITKWRSYQYVFTSDIEKMYRQILVDPEDQPFQSILWKENLSEDIQIFQLTTVTYGLACSAFLASRVLRQLANDHKTEFPLGASILKDEIYMDDVLSGAHSIDDALSKRSEVINLAKAGGFSLRKWSSNHPQLLLDLPLELLASNTLTLRASQTVVSVLGLTWNPQGDFFSFSIQTDPEPESLTKRKVLSKIARLFDPLGWLSPALVGGKIFMRSLWLEKVDWDDPLSQKCTIEWNNWYDQLPSISEIKIPRWSCFTPSATIVELHGFADASKKAYGAVIYLKIVHNGQTSVTLQMAKTKVAPINELSTPCLELVAAHLLGKITYHFIEYSQIKLASVHLWSDSRDVLHWLHDHPSRWKVFVAHRCAEIHTWLPQALWHHVKTSQNPADLNSRGLEPSKLKENKLWWRGPEFLYDPLYKYPRFVKDEVMTHNVVVELEMPFKLADPEPEKLWDLNFQHVDLSKLFRITSYCLRYIFKLLRKIRTKLTPIKSSKLLQLKFFKEDLTKSTSLKVTPREQNDSRLFWVYLLQQLHFPDEIGRLSSNRPLKSSSRLLKFFPKIEKDLLRVGGRLSFADLSPDVKYPLILPSGTHLTNLLVQQAHELTLHGGTQLTLATVRQQYWILKGRQVVKSIISKCLRCRRYAARPHQQLMSDLPKARVQPCPPFQKSGLDYAGPFKIRLSKSRGNTTLKGYVALFVCMSTKAVHLEVVEDYTAEAFLAAFNRFVSRRGHCNDLFSDCGTNFVGADQDLLELFRQASFNENLFFNLSKSGTHWHFNPPSAPHFGGLWEAAVKSAKFHLKRIIGEQILTFAEFSTLLCRIEACLNSRPLVPLSDEPPDLEPLTPSHFLIQRPSYLVPEPNAEQITSYGARYKLTTAALQHFWKRWSAEYLVSLQSRNKWLKIEPAIKIGDLVLVKNENTPPGQWPLARVIAVTPSKDGLVRKAVVQTATTTLERPVVKLIYLANEQELATPRTSVRPNWLDEGGRCFEKSRFNMADQPQDDQQRSTAESVANEPRNGSEACRDDAHS